MSEHTKGPWSIDDGRTVVGQRSDKPGPQMIGAVFGIVEYGDVRDKEKAAANARLIAAAPELLEALKRAVEIRNLNGAAHAAACDKLYGPNGLAHTAIAKATGA